MWRLEETQVTQLHKKPGVGKAAKSGIKRGALGIPYQS